MGSAADDSSALRFFEIFFFWEQKRLCNGTLWKWLVSGDAADDWLLAIFKPSGGGSKRIRGWRRIFRGNDSSTICKHHNSNNSNSHWPSLLKRRKWLQVIPLRWLFSISCVASPSILGCPLSIYISQHLKGNREGQPFKILRCRGRRGRRLQIS